jgi:predicted GIY-YIG superfamily endonuclease
LKVYKAAFELSMRIFAVSKTWPPEERYALTDQIRRASRSVGANLAEAWLRPVVCGEMIDEFVVYAIRSKRTQRIYIGQTADMVRRLTEHNRGNVSSTAKDGPWELIKLQQFPSRAKARWFERSLKVSRGKRMRWLHHD